MISSSVFLRSGFLYMMHFCICSTSLTGSENHLASFRFQNTFLLNVWNRNGDRWFSDPVGEVLYMAAILFLSVYASVESILKNWMILNSRILFYTTFFCWLDTSVIENLKYIPSRSNNEYLKYFGALADDLYSFAIMEYPLAIIFLSFSFFVSAQVLKYTNLNAGYVHFFTSFL